MVRVASGVVCVKLNSLCALLLCILFFRSFFVNYAVSVFGMRSDVKCMADCRRCEDSSREHGSSIILCSRVSNSMVVARLNMFTIHAASWLRCLHSTCVHDLVKGFFVACLKSAGFLYTATPNPMAMSRIANPKVILEFNLRIALGNRSILKVTWRERIRF